jgi:hypothetical protein
MAVASKIISPLVTPPLKDSSPTAKIAVGTIVHTDAGGVAEYIVAGAEISAYCAVLIYEQGTAAALTTTLAQEGTGSGRKVGCVQTSIASAYYGWAMRQGTFLMRLSDDCADNVSLFTTANAGELDDATVSNCLVAGVYLPVTASLATALTVVAATPMYVHPYTNPA